MGHATRVSQPGGEVRILVVEPATASADAARVLARLGPEAAIERIDAAECAERCRSQAERIDLVVVDDSIGGVCRELLEALRRDGPPVIVVNSAGDEAGALEAFRRGAADCVAAGREFRDVLPRVALEQIHRWRAEREQTAAERRFRDLERYHTNIIQNLNSALLVVDSEARIAFCNPPAEDLLGESAEALRGRPVLEFFASAGAEAPVARTLRTGERLKGAEATITRADGSILPIGISCAPVLDAGGLELGAVAVFSDLTEIRQLQRQVVQTEKMASIGQLAAGVAHEINNPMGFIHANLFQMAEYLTDLRRVWEHVEALADATEKDDADTARESVAALRETAREVDLDFILSDFSKAIRESQEGSERIRHIVQDLRDFSHRDSEERVVADVNECLESTANIVWPMMKQLVVLEKDYADLPEIHCYPMQLKQVFMNLLVNAYQAIEQRLGDRGETGSIWLRTGVADDVVTITVTDTGTGIAPENLARIFDPFFTTKKVGSGTGLGLSTCFNIVERHGGALRVESTPDEGSTFTVVLPSVAHPGDGGIPDADLPDGNHQ